MVLQFRRRGRAGGKLNPGEPFDKPEYSEGVIRS